MEDPPTKFTFKLFSPGLVVNMGDFNNTLLVFIQVGQNHFLLALKTKWETWGKGALAPQFLAAIFSGIVMFLY